MPYRDAPTDVAICPRCTDASLQAHSRGLARVLACRSCGGVFAERDTVLAMLEGRTRELVELAEEATRAPPRPKLLPTDLECPRCQAVMRRLPVRRAQVLIDVCPAHGVWFDRWETQLVSYAIHDPDTEEAIRRALE